MDESSNQTSKEEPLCLQLCKAVANMSPESQRQAAYASNGRLVSRKPWLTCLIEQQGAVALGVDMRDLGGPPAAVVRPVQL